MSIPHQKLAPLLEKHQINWESFCQKGRPVKGTEGAKAKRSAIVTELHAAGCSWAEMIEITGLSNGAIQRLTGAMWNEASRDKVREIGRKVGSSWKGKERPGQLERQWQSGDFDRPETRAKYSMTAITTLQKYPKRWYPQGIPETVPTIKGDTPTVRVRSSYEKKAIRMLDADPEVVSYRYEPLLRLSNGKGILPDFVVCQTNGQQVLIEVKPGYVLKDPVRFASQIQRLSIAEQEARSLGWGFAIWTEKELGL